jgi:replicative DNA helicase
MGPIEPTERIERTLLGEILRDPTTLAEVMLQVDVEDFSSLHHQELYLTLVNLWIDSKPIDLASVADHLHRTGQLANVGGYSWLATTWEDAPTAAHVAYHAKLVADRSLLRRLRLAAGEIAASTNQPDGSSEEVLDSALAKMLTLAGRFHRTRDHALGELLPPAVERIRQRRSGQVQTGIPTGFTDLDDLLGGLHPSELVILAARPSVGKTALAVNVAANLASQGYQVLFVSLEQGREELAERWLAMLAGVDLYDLRSAHRLNELQLEALESVSVEQRAAPVRVDDRTEQTVLRIAAAARRLKSLGRLDCLVVDYLQLLKAEDSRLPRHEQVGQMSRRLKLLARELACPVVVLAQLNRAMEGRSDSTPRLSDLRESGSLEQDADAVLLLHRIDDRGSVEVIVAKNRNGRTGEVILTFDRALQRFQTYVTALGS